MKCPFVLKTQKSVVHNYYYDEKGNKIADEVIETNKPKMKHCIRFLCAAWRQGECVRKR